MPQILINKALFMFTTFLQLLCRKYWVCGHVPDVEIFALSLYNILDHFTRQTALSMLTINTI